MKCCLKKKKNHTFFFFSSWKFMSFDRGNNQIPLPDLDNNFQEEEREDLTKTKDLNLPHMIIDSVPQITCSQLASLLNNPFDRSYDSIVILDARFHYEYAGGHICSAKNITSRAQLAAIYKQYAYQNVCVVCHCEFSHSRGPSLYNLLRGYDRSLNKYPNMGLPEMYVLHGGYRSFYAQYPGLCTGGYTPMRSKEHVENGDLKIYNSKYKKEMKQPVFGLLKRSNSTGLWESQTIALPQSQDSFKSSFLSLSSSQQPTL